MENQLPNEILKSWCRLCAKNKSLNSINMFNEINAESKLSIANAIEKCYSLEMNEDDWLPKMLCNKCFSLLTTYVNYIDHIRKVQIMFDDILSSKLIVSESDLEPIRLRYGIGDESWEEQINCVELATNINNEKRHDLETNARTIIEDPLSVLDIEIKEEPDTEIEMPLRTFENDNMQLFNTKTEEDVADVVKSSSNTNENINIESNDSNKILTKKSLNSDKIDKNFACTDVKVHLNRKHKELLLESKTNVCNECGKEFKKQSLLRRHVKTHKSVEQRKLHPCPQCQNLFTSNDSLQAHIKIVHNSKYQSICEICGHVAKTKNGLMTHLYSHSDNRDFECKECSKRFKSKFSLKMHMDIHNSHKFKCDVCGLALSSRYTLRNHLTTHSDVLSHKCDVCGRGFKLSKYLKSHLITHIGIKPYSCDFCELTFAHSSNCRLHMKNEHTLDFEKLEKNKSTTILNIPSLKELKALTKNVDNLVPLIGGKNK